MDRRHEFNARQHSFPKELAALPLATYKIGETVLAAGSKTGRLLILKKGAVIIVKETIKIAKVTEPGAVFGELSALLDQPHTADVHAVETSQFHMLTRACSCKTQSCSSTLQGCWRGVLIMLLRPSSN